MLFHIISFFAPQCIWDLESTEVIQGVYSKVASGGKKKKLVLHLPQ